jgi:hypothetical protein
MDEREHGGEGEGQRQGKRDSISLIIHGRRKTIFFEKTQKVFTFHLIEKREFGVTRLLSDQREEEITP